MLTDVVVDVTVVVGSGRFRQVHALDNADARFGSMDDVELALALLTSRAIAWSMLEASAALAAGALFLSSP